ncbi:STAS domain-containing protein [Streptomyces sp. NPDC088354]|uniref:STAS domain-containing protein n=1 Tax=unclassified Streptomyces TaxID=2593676 RepID=UPI0029B9D442|nr:STAS domain-containing protein [Streptomyces sp. MI02-7b]MDX3074109.1 STAS domain-containing protein [Streptomyces sp. MI02-7b]
MEQREPTMSRPDHTHEDDDTALDPWALPVHLPPGGTRSFAGRATLSLATRGTDGVVAVITGEVDAGCAADLERCLVAAMRAHPEGLELDLSGVTFFDCAGLNALLKARTFEARGGGNLTIKVMSPRVARVLDLTETRTLLTRSL